MNARFSTISPIDNSVYVERTYASAGDIDSTLDAAKTAQQAWEKFTLAERKALCAKAIDAFVSKKAVIAEEICWQMGRCFLD